MKSLKPLLLGVILGLLIGLWMGVNIGKEKALFSNPFAERGLQDKIKSTVGEGVEKVGESIDKLGKDIKGKMEK